MSGLGMITFLRIGLSASEPICAEAQQRRLAVLAKCNRLTDPGGYGVGIPCSLLDGGHRGLSAVRSLLADWQQAD